MSETSVSSVRSTADWLAAGAGRSADANRHPQSTRRAGEARRERRVSAWRIDGESLIAGLGTIPFK
jgi:hypothetical protein